MEANNTNEVLEKIKQHKKLNMATKLNFSDPVTTENIHTDSVLTDQEQRITLPLMLSIREAAEKTNLSYEFIRYLCNSGKIKCLRYGRKIMINAGSLVEFIENGCDGYV